MSREFIQAPFIVVPQALLQGGNGLNAAAIAVWCALARWADKDGKCWRPIRLLARDIGQCERTVQKAIKALRENGWIKVTLHKGAHSDYRLIWGGSNAMSMQSTKDSDAPNASLGENITPKTAQEREKEEKWRISCVTSDAPNASDLYSLSILRKEERERPTNPLFSQKAKQGNNQDKEQEQTDHYDGTGSIEVVPPDHLRHTSIDEQYQQEQERLMQQKKPDSAPAVEEGKHD